MVLVLVVIYELVISFGFGVGVKLLFKLCGVGEDMCIFNILLFFIYILCNQLIFYFGYIVFFNYEKYLFKGNLEFSKFLFIYFGIGNNIFEVDSCEIVYINFLIELLLFCQVSFGFFVGGGICYNIYRGVKLNEVYNDLEEGIFL